MRAAWVKKLLEGDSEKFKALMVHGGMAALCVLYLHKTLGKGDENKQKKGLKLYAVGGKDADRKMRKLLVDECCAELEPISFALANGDETFRIPPIIQNLECINKKLALPLKPQTPAIEANDVVCLIGTIKPAAFDALLEKSNLAADVWLQGPGFNYGTLTGDELPKLKAKSQGFVYSFAAPECPVYPAKTWNSDIFPLYPTPLRDLRVYQIGTFWLTPLSVLIRLDKPADQPAAPAVFTDAFIRQFQLHRLVQERHLVAFHQSVLADVLSSGGVPPASERILTDMGRGLAEIATVADAKEQLERISVLYAGCKELLSCTSTLAAFTRTLMVQMEQWSAGIREYDGFVVHQMLRHLAGLQKLDVALKADYELHLRFVRDSLGGQVSDYIRQLRGGDRSRRLILLHDLGLDPQSDDWIAIQMLRCVW